MQYFKLQIGCMLVILYIEITYNKEATRGKVPRNLFYDILLKIAPWAVFFDGLTAWTVNHMDATNVSNAAPLHDIGKISTPDSILQKPGKLTDEEYRIMKNHAAAGGEIIRQTFQDSDHVEFRQIAYEVARYHHEKYNGKGYPEGLVGEAIPLHARIMAIADVFDAVSQKRCYRDAMPIEDCFAIIEHGIGTDFDPRLARIFLNATDEVVELMREKR